MRIAGGDWRGRALDAPPGRDTRPTSGRTREAVFNILEHAPWAPDVEGLNVIDLFAGSGALGLEALSRGAGFCLFVESAGPALRALRANIQALGAGARTSVLARDVARLGPCPAGQGPFDLAFLDPPYARGLGEAALVALRDGGWLAPAAVVVFERGADEPAPNVAGFEVLDERRYGAARVWFLSLG